MRDLYFMDLALLEAKQAMLRGDVPVGALIVRKEEILAVGSNIKTIDPTAHAEIGVIRKAAEHLGYWNLNECTLYVTLEPCMMCLGAIIEARIKNVYFGTKNNSKQMYDKIRVKSFVNLIFVNSGSCSKILSDFFIVIHF